MIFAEVLGVCDDEKRDSVFRGAASIFLWVFTNLLLTDSNFAGRAGVEKRLFFLAMGGDCEQFRSGS